MIVNETKFRVRYGETDKMGNVHHATYFLYFEEGRTELLRDFGFTYREMEDNGIILPVISVECQYKAPAFYDDILTVRTYLKKIPTVKMLLEYEIYNEENILICHGNSILAFTNAKNRRPMRPPHYFIELIKPYFNN